ncbi:tRNA glutamyl-Q(34) synthetase GluQRS [Psychrobacter sp. AOP22-C1-22]|uniref:tRNA glutamyl-Q(34) synthetase GluQRS n=1 Tax=unclassified Psychrobacter TaxID=196806 RepID=UPI0017888E17|nr:MULTISPECIES: tRNA glutamyl-Q(34) synthetase GluQRS [unclassified Psychrobacter]MDN5801059.1 tRNA glutamyl-Q(34) synthetase GluQRS [Psychrobacter sp.]MBE0405923.1 tRNA glutamyl-Q(34) synthetase GluQRS [Psychrobacter sp. FME6]MBE0444022.1 tRNA glutamyl-Q(34) synthetase GluQRS [Psychrobacter sp. FME5]MDN5890733.1 tRNA glutamyl-Q(34) synthetase GluQRS [Psychrobacter sp.]MDN5897190.1 tRNA glutamyl-Q(34) synthetase GluQRS [Psychrobacter sp.]
MLTQTSSSQPIGRFAPSPTGELHLGSLTTAIASYCHIKSLGGKWLLRIEDTDTERCDRQFTEQILIDLEALGLYWDGDVIYQSERIDIYNDYLSSSLQSLTYGCQCSRKDLEQYWAQKEPSKHHDAVSSLQPNRTRYPRRCVGADLDRQQHKLRIQLPDYRIGFNDGIQGMQWDNPQQTLGDMVVRRQDGMINYILAASLDDGLQQITHIMRGLDILPMTTAQISIMQAAGLPAIDHWSHLPLICHSDGQKLSKQNLAQPIDTRNPSQLITDALQLLQQPTVDRDTPSNMLRQAVAQWDNTPLQGKQQLNIPNG